MTGRLVDMSFSLNRKQRITLEVDSDFRSLWDKLNQEPLLDIEIKKHRNKRSHSANAYFHVLVNKIAAETGESDDLVKERLVVAYVGRPTANDLWNDAAVAARKIEANLYYMHIGGLITVDGKLNRDDLKRRNTEIFAALPVAVQRWAGSPEDLSDIFSSRSTADLRQFVRPGFDRTVADAPIESLQPPALPGGAAPAQIGGGTA